MQRCGGVRVVRVVGQVHRGRRGGGGDGTDHRGRPGPLITSSSFESHNAPPPSSVLLCSLAAPQTHEGFPCARNAS